MDAVRAPLPAIRPTDRTRLRKDAETKFPIKIDLPVPPGGLRRRLTDMLAWWQENVAVGAWAQQGFMDRKRRDERGIPIDFMLWDFMSDADAEAFRKRWVTD